MSDMKCPFCGHELTVYEYSAFTNVGFLPCEKCRIEGTKEMWEALIRTRKALDVATVFIKGISQTVINDCDNQYVVLGNFKKFAQDTIEQITTLEQEQ